VVAHRLSIAAPGADAMKACAGVRLALANVSASIRADPARRVRVIGAEKMTA
jgi:3-oxoacyl-[acyl-carrier-protein] synthase III